MDTHGLLRHSHHPYDFGSDRCAARAHHLEAGAQREVRRPPAHCAVDVPHLALRFRDGSHRLRDALQTVAGAGPCVFGHAFARTNQENERKLWVKHYGF